MDTQGTKGRRTGLTRRLCGGLALPLLALLLAADPATADARFVHAQRYETNGLGGAIASALSPDGRFLYVAGFTDSSLTVFARDPASGSLTFQQAYYDNDATPFPVRGESYDGLLNAVDVAISPDGIHLYTAGWGDNAIGVYRRQPSGAVTYLGKVVVASVLDSVSSLALTADGLGLWSASFAGASVCHFTRDPATGWLSSHGCITHANLAGARSLVLADGDSQVLVAAKDADALVCVSALTGSPWIGGIGANTSLDGAYDVAVSPDGADAYVALFDGQALAHLDRTAGAPCGQLVQTHAFGTGAKAAAWVDPRGTGIVVAGIDDGRIYRLLRDPTTGALSSPLWFPLSTVGADSPVGLTGTPDGQRLYVSNLSGHLSAHGIDPTSYPWQLHAVGGPQMPLLEALHDVVYSSSDRDVYMVGERALLRFRREPVAGALTPSNYLFLGGSRVWSLAISPSQRLYLAREGSGTVARHAFNLAPEGVDSSTLTSISDLAISANRAHLYAVSDADESLVVMTVSPASGGLTEVQRLGAITTPPGSSTVGVSGVAASPDGNKVFVAAYGTREVATFSFDASGALTYAGSAFVGNSTTSQRARLAVSPDSRNVYAVGLLGDDLQVFGYGLDDFVLHLETHLDGVAGVTGLAAVQDVVVTGDGRQVIVVGDQGSAAVFHRDPVDGRLVFRRALFDGTEGVRGLSGARAVATTPDGRFVYVAGHGASGGFSFPTGAAVVLDTSALFLDGFESGDTSAW